MASPQCLGYSFYKSVTKELCYPSKKEIIKRTRKIVAKTKVKSVYVATDSDPMLSELRKGLSDLKVW